MNPCPSTSSDRDLPPPPELLAAAPAGRHRPPPPPGFFLRHELGRGGMGVVYLAEQLALRREVAIKFLPPTASEAHAARARAEAEAVARLRHPNIVQIHEIGYIDELPYLVGVTRLAWFDGARPSRPHFVSRAAGTAALHNGPSQERFRRPRSTSLAPTA